MSNIDQLREQLAQTDPGPHAEKWGSIYIGSVAQQLNATLQLLTKEISDSTGRIIKSSEELALSNDKYSKAMVGLTWVLVITAIIQAVSFFVP